MAGFTAFNIEPDDYAEDEIDNTKEIQIEDALKLYQVALKHHSQGPNQYDQAKQAYTDLLNSEIFKYAESETEFNRIARQPELDYDEAALALELAAARADAAPSTLPQILYLTYKNHGQFILDCVKALVPDQSLNDTAPTLQAYAAIENFVLALTSDESDTDLWRRCARVAATLGSRRISRYCLEAAVEADDDPTVAEVEPASLEEGFAGKQLKELLEALSDETAISHPIMAPFLKKVMPGFLAKHMDPYPFLPDSTRSLGDGKKEPKMPPKRLKISVEFRSWTAVGNKFCDIWLSEFGSSGMAVELQIPPEVAMHQDIELSQLSTSGEDQIMKDVSVIESPSFDNTDPTVTITAKPGDQLVGKATITTIPLADEPQSSSAALPTRKRTQSNAGLRENGDDDISTQKRSKRIRNRDNGTADEAVDPATQYAEQLEKYVRADEDFFNFIGDLLKKLNINCLGTISDLHAALAIETPANRDECIANTVVRDLRDILKNWDEAKASTYINGNATDILGSSAGSENAGLVTFLNQPKAGPSRVSSIPHFNDEEELGAFVERLESGCLPLRDAIIEWILVVIPTYHIRIWSEDLKIAAVRLLSYADAEIFEHFKSKAESLRTSGEDMSLLVEMTEALLELHVDVYFRITDRHSAVSFNTRFMSKDRLARWVDFAGDVVGCGSKDPTSELSLRYLWTSVTYATMAEDVSREHKVSCWSDLQLFLRKSGKPAIELPNNAVISEISAEAADREVSKLTSMDFFLNPFQTDKSDPTAIIEILEPVLDPESALQTKPDAEDSSDSVTGAWPVLHDMWKFLKAGSTSLRLFLWQRLREAYLSIGYNTKVFSCHLKSIEIIVEDLRSVDYVDTIPDLRQHKLLTWLKALDDLLVKSLTIALNEAATCFEIIDERHLKSTCTALAQLNRILHAAAIFDDEVRVGKFQQPSTAIYGDRGSFNVFINKLREMQVRTWALQYTMLKEAMSQYHEEFPTSDNNLADYLALVHNALGIRKSCKASNKIFLKMMKVELMRLKHIERWEDYVGPVLYDLYGIKLGVGTYLIEDHGCPTEQLDRRTVLNISDRVISIAKTLPIKDLLKHELRQTIEHMQTAVGQVKPSNQMQHNLRNYTEYLKTSIRPLDMYKAWKGQLQVDSLPVNHQDTPLANKGWYFLLGILALTKFRSQKRLGPGSQTDDMRVGATFMRLQLQFSPDDWETWFRLAQCFDYELEDEIMWTADKINNHKAELVRLQRGAIHCYIMALSTARRLADDSHATAEKLSELYHEFGMRLYASSREPFGMQTFWVDEFEKHMSGVGGMYKKPLHEEMTRYRVWKYALGLFRQSLLDRPDYWMNHFMIGKCLWKMYCKWDDEPDPKVKDDKPKVDDILKAFVSAIKTVPKPAKSTTEPIIEPHYKLIAIVYKLVGPLEAMEPQAGADLLQQQLYTVRKGDPVTIKDADEWDSYIIEQVRHLRKEDKQHWQHRMVARIASIIYAGGGSGPEAILAAAAAAKNEFRENTFTKTMHIQVWKPDAERPGRHCVYMERYTRFMISLLEVTNDKINMEALVKRVRKKGTEFQNFVSVWTEACTAYVRLIRRSSSIVSSIDDIFKSVATDEFDAVSDRLTSWIADPMIQHPALDALRETMELKKLNASLMKPAPIDDLINDSWAVLYTEIGKILPAPDLERARSDVDGDAPGPTSNSGSMSLGNLVMDMNGSQIPVPVSIAVGSHAEPSKARKVGIARREVLRRAELAVNRAPDTARAQAAVPNGGKALVSGLVSSERQPGRSEQSTPRDIPRKPTGCDGGSAAGGEDSNTNEELTGGGDEGAEEDVESERGSLNDSADDESDLSDVPEMDDVDTSLMFPNLVSHETDVADGQEELV